MIARCPTCGARCRIDRERLPAAGARVRCPRCEAVFRVRPAPAGEQAPASPERATPPAAAAPAPSDTPPPPPPGERERLVLVADADVERGKALAGTLAGWGLQPILVHDGVEAILTVQRALPRAVVLDAALPKMFGFQICELVKRNESLRSIHVVLVGSIHDPARYRRPPSELYGADAYLERPQLPEALQPLLRGFGFALGGAAAAAAPRPAPPASAPETPPEPAADAALRSPEPVATPAPGPAAEAASAPERVSDGDPRVAQAERLARIIVSDVVLYNQDRFEAAVRAGNVIEAMEGEMREGRSHFEQRVPAELRAQRDFLGEELLRVARTRGNR